MLLKPESTCWRVSNAERVGLIVDVQDYYRAAREAMGRARRSIHILGWAWDPSTLFAPDGEAEHGPDDRWGPWLRDFAVEHREVDVRLLVWKSALPVAATQNFFPHRARALFGDTPVNFRLDGALPLGACHHQKVIVIDDELAFAGGCDVGPDRWDTQAHRDDDPHRRKPGGGFFDARHETMCVFDGHPARDMGALFRARWKRASGETLAEPDSHAIGGSDAWPPCIAVALKGVRTGISRSEPHWRHYPEIRETEKLHLASIGAARRFIYLENQYFACPVMAEALAARLEEADGPEIMLVSTQHSPSWFDQMTMDRTRLLFLKRLKASDHYGRLSAFCPVTAEGRIIIVHSKLSIIDNDLVRVGSANLNNRSTGFDTECDLSFEAEGPAQEVAIARFRAHLIAHWLAQPTEIVAEGIKTQGLAATVAALDDPARPRLQPIAHRPIGAFGAFVATYHIGDPTGPGDSWRPWLRRRALKENLRHAALVLEQQGLDAPAEVLRDETV